MMKLNQTRLKNIGKTIETFKLLMQMKISSKDGNMRRECEELGIYDRYLQIIGLYFDVDKASSHLSDKNIEMLREKCCTNKSVIYRGEFYRSIMNERQSIIKFREKCSRDNTNQKNLSQLLKGDLSVVDLDILCVLQNLTNKEVRSLASLYVRDISKILRDKELLTEQQRHNKEIKKQALDQIRQNEGISLIKEDFSSLLKRSGLSPESIAQRLDLDIVTVRSWFNGWLYGVDDYQLLGKLLSDLGLKNIFALKARIENTASQITKFNKSIDTLRYLLILRCLHDKKSIRSIFEEELEMAHSTPYKWMQEKNFATINGYMAHRTEKKIKAMIEGKGGIVLPYSTSRIDHLIDEIRGSKAITKENLLNMTSDTLRMIARKLEMSPMEIGILYQNEVKHYVKRK